MGSMGEEMEREYHADLPLKNIKADITKMQREYTKERDKRHT